MYSYYVDYGNETFRVTNDGLIGRPRTGMKPSGNWRITGAVRFNNFGHIVERKSFPECMGIKDWRYKNGKQKWHIKDLDHGTARTWMSPTHAVYKDA